MENRLSREYFERQEMMANLRVPTLSEVKLRAGLHLSLVLLQQCHPDLQKEFGLQPPLNGPRGPLWTSPSDLLVGKVALTPPVTQKHIQALTHEGILALGTEIEKKFLNEMRMERERAVDEREAMMTRMFEVQKMDLLEEIRDEEKKKYEGKLHDLKTYHERQVCGLVYQCGSQVEHLLDQMQVEIDSLHVLWQERLEQQIDETVTKMTEEFLEKLRKQENVLVKTFRKKIDRLKIKHRCNIDFEKIKSNENILQLRHKLHCENLSNLMYLLCKERRRCKSEKVELEETLEAEVQTLKDNLNQKSRTIRKLTRDVKKKTRQVQVRERCLLEILRQFQKFIYYALKATPTQGEFLLNVNKLINFELEDYCLPAVTESPQAEEPPAATPTETSAYDYSRDIEDFLRKREDDEAEDEGMPYDGLPAFYFNDKIYVREDFRDLISAGIAINRRSTLWNPDVEELLNVFKQRVQKRPAALLKVKSHQSSVHFSDKEDDGSNSGSCEYESISPILDSKMSTSDEPPAIKRMPSEEDEKEIRKLSLMDTPDDVRKAGSESEKSKKEKKVRSRDSKDEDFDIKAQPERRQSRLSFTRDSLILQIAAMERKSLQAIIAKEQVEKAKMPEEDSKTSSEKAKVTKVEENMSRGSSDRVHVWKRASDETLTALSPDKSKQSSRGSLDTPVESHTSKLILATDSIDIIKSSMTSGEQNLDEEPKSRKSQLSFNPNVTVEGSDFEMKRGDLRERKRLKSTSRPRSTKRNGRGIKPRFVAKAKVVGERGVREHLMEVGEFTADRINSLVALMTEDPSIMRLFTQCRQ